jgi:hypothetical protein
MPPTKIFNSLDDPWPFEPRRHLPRRQLKEHALTSVLDRWKPSRLEGNLGSFHIRLVFALDIGSYSFKTSEANQGEHLAEAMDLDHCIDAIRQVSSSPEIVGKPPGVEVGIHGNVIAETFGHSEERIQLNLLDRSLVNSSISMCVNCFEYFVVFKGCEALGDDGLLLEESQVFRGLNDLQVAPQLGNCSLHFTRTVGQRQNTQHL